MWQSWSNVASFKRSTQASSRRMVESKTGAFCTRSCPFSSLSSSFTSKSLQSWTRNVSRNASENGWKRSNRRSRKPPVHQREPRVAAVSGFPGTAGRVPTGSPKRGRCAAVRERCGNAKHRRKTLAGNFGQRAKPQAAKQEKAKVSCAHLGEHICPQCGQFGAFDAGVVERAKIAPLGSEAQIISLFQGKQRGHTQNWREISMANRKIKFPLWLMPETKATVERL